MRKAVIISANSFFSPGPRVGMQSIAQILARNRFEVHFISQPSSPLDVFCAERRPRFRRAWLSMDNCRQVEPNLIEHFVRAPFPVSKKFWLFPRQCSWYGKLLPRRLRRQRFDVCLHDMSSCFSLLESLNFSKLILRLSDHPRGFAHVAPGILIDRLIAGIAGGRYQQTWPVSQGLFDYVAALQPGGSHVLLSNGVDCGRFLCLESPGQRQRQTAVFVGSLDRWVDQDLLDEAAGLLPDWRFDLYGPQPARRQFRTANLILRGPVDHGQLPTLLRRYQVGLIPFKTQDTLVEMMERPLKFYEYLAAGLGIAATDAGGLRRGMGDWAHYGRNAAEFAQAVQRAALDADKCAQERQNYLQEYSWPSIGDRVLAQVNQALAA